MKRAQTFRKNALTILAGSEETTMRRFKEDRDREMMLSECLKRAQLVPPVGQGKAMGLCHGLPES